MLWLLFSGMKCKWPYEQIGEKETNRMSVCLYLVIQRLCTFIALFCTYFFAVVARLRRESYLFHFFGGRERLSFCFPEFRYNTVFKNSPPEKITNIWRIGWDGISATNWLKSRWAGFINSGEYKISHHTSVPFWICPEAGFSSNFPALDTRKIRRRALFSVTLSRKKPCPVGPSLCTADPCPLLKNKSISPYFF